MAEYYDSINYEYIRTHHSEDYVEALINAAERVASVEDSIKISTEMVFFYELFQTVRLSK